MLVGADYTCVVILHNEMLCICRSTMLVGADYTVTLSTAAIMIVSILKICHYMFCGVQISVKTCSTSNCHIYVYRA